MSLQGEHTKGIIKLRKLHSLTYLQSSVATQQLQLAFPSAQCDLTKLCVFSPAGY